LFAGAGGLAIGLESAGFDPLSLYEIDKHACATLAHNTSSQNPTVRGTVLKVDVRSVDWSRVERPVTLVSGGVPCQPFSLGGKHLAHRDNRNLFPEALRAVRQLRPAVVLLENVKGLLRPSFRPYFEYVVDVLSVPSLMPKASESWYEHHLRVLKHRNANSFVPEYQVVYEIFMAADFGVPQLRERVFVVATRSDLPKYSFPKPTHSRASLTRSQVTGEYWERHRVPNRARGAQVGRSTTFGDRLLPWVTVRDALADLGEPSSDEAASWDNHWLIPGARKYAGHSGSSMDWPAKTIKAGVHGVPGGENSVVTADGRLRYFTLRELARIQTFPDAHFFLGARTHVTRQIGNAVPCILAAAVAKPLYCLLQEALPEWVTQDVTAV